MKGFMQIKKGKSSTSVSAKKQSVEKPSVERWVIGQTYKVNTKLVRPMPDQPRKYFDPVDLNEFADELKEQGQTVPALVKVVTPPDKNGCQLELISGERRWRSCSLKQMDLKVTICEPMDAAEQFTQAVLANLHGVSLSLLENALAVRDFKKFGKSHEEIAKIYRKKSGKQWVEQHLRILELHPDVLKLIGPETPEGQRIPLTSAISLIPLPQEYQVDYAIQVSRGTMTALQLKHQVRNRLAERGIKRKNRSSDDFRAAVAFFKMVNARIEQNVDFSEGRIAALFKGRTPDEIRELMRLTKDCGDNLYIVYAAFEAEAEKSLAPMAPDIIAASVPALAQAAVAAK